MAKRPVVGALIDGETSWHADSNNGANYHTLCGLSLDDDLVQPLKAAPDQKITCKDCYHIWSEARLFKRIDFDLS